MLAQIVLFDGFDPLDVIAPFEVLAAGAEAAHAATFEVLAAGAEAAHAAAIEVLAAGAEAAHAAAIAGDAPLLAEVAARSGGSTSAGTGRAPDATPDPRAASPVREAHGADAADEAHGADAADEAHGADAADEAGGPDAADKAGGAGNGADTGANDRTPTQVRGSADDILEVRLVSADGPGPVVSGTLGLVLQATARLDPSLPGFVIVPGASGPVDGDPDRGDVTVPVLLARFASSPAAPLLRAALDNPRVTVATVCGGSLALAMAGLIEGRHAVTHTLGMDVLEATGVRAVRARVVDDGDLVTAGGVTSGLDLALYLLERTFGSRVAHDVEALFEYERRGTVWHPARQSRTSAAGVPS